MANPGEPPTGQPVINWSLMCEKLGAQVNQLENDNADLQRKLSILEKETTELVAEFLKPMEQPMRTLVEAAIRANYTAIATLLEQS